jgi:transcription elongation GreA/GreB family factor
MGHREGEGVKVSTPGGIVNLQIVRIGQT